MKQTIKRRAGRSRIWLPVLTGPARGTRIRLADVHPRDFPRYVLGGYEQPTVRFLHTALKHARVFLDIGAEQGYFTRIALRTMPPGGAIVAFEPRPAGRDALRRLPARKGLHLQIRPEPLAHEDRAGEFAFGDDFGYATARQGLPVHREYPVETVQFRSLDSLHANDEIPDPDVVKIDVEGLEADVLRGAAKLLDGTQPTLAIECHNLRLVHEVIGELLDAGYRNVDITRVRLGAGPWQILAPRPAREAGRRDGSRG